MTYFIALEPGEHYDGGDQLHLYETDAKLTRVLRWCRTKNYEFIAYGEMTVFGDDGTLNSDQMTSEIREWIRKKRKQREEWAQRQLEPPLTEAEVRERFINSLARMSPAQQIMARIEYEIFWGFPFITPPSQQFKFVGLKGQLEDVT